MDENKQDKKPVLWTQTLRSVSEYIGVTVMKYDTQWHCSEGYWKKKAHKLIRNIGVMSEKHSQRQSDRFGDCEAGVYLTEIPERKHKTKQGKAKLCHLERAFRERSRTRGGERMTIINFPETRKGFTVRDVINSVKEGDCRK